MALLIFYLATLIVGLLMWLPYYVSRDTDQGRSDAMCLGVILATTYVLSWTIIAAIAIWPIVYQAGHL